MKQPLATYIHYTSHTVNNAYLGTLCVNGHYTCCEDLHTFLLFFKFALNDHEIDFSKSIFGQTAHIKVKWKCHVNGKQTKKQNKTAV